MTIKSLLFILFLCLCLVWAGAAYWHPGAEFRSAGLLWTIWVLSGALTIVIGARLFGWWRLWRAKAAVRPAAPAKPAPVVHEDDAALAALIADANAALAKAPNYAGPRGKSPLSGLPLYLLIGPEGTGKTSTFLSCGVEPQAIAGQTSPGATRLANFWLAKNAVFVEISGRAFSGDIGRWSALLSGLRGKAAVPFWRRLWREPDEGLLLRGVIGFCDVRELTGAAADPQRLERGCREWQERLRAIGEVFGVEFPVYQVFTKCDKIPFFSDFFARLPESEVNQVLGCTVPIRKPDSSRATEVFAEVEAKRLTGAFRPLYHSLAERRLTHLAHEPNPARKPGIYEFPRELKRIRAPLVQFLTDVFRPHPLGLVPLLRGFYLTATQEVEIAVAKPAANEADWTSPNLSMETTRLFRGDATQIFNVDDPAGGQPRGRKGMGNRWIFASDLLHQIVLADRPPVQRTVAKDAHFERYRRGVLASICAICILLCLAFVTSWVNNRSLLGNVKDVAKADIKKHDTRATLTDLRALEDLRQQVDRLEKGESLGYRWGLYTGNAIRDNARRAYLKRFQQLLLADLNEVMLAHLLSLPASPDPDAPYDTAYDQLKTHLAISSGSCTAESSFVARVLKDARGQLAPDMSPAWQKLADNQINFYVNEPGNSKRGLLAENAAARDHARQYLLAIRGTDRIYRGILADAEKALSKPQHLEDLAPDYKKVLNGDGELSGVYSPAGWRFVEAASKKKIGTPGDPCVTGTSLGYVGEFKQDSETEKQIQQLFIKDYIDHWQKFVAGFSVLPYKGAADAAQKLDILAGHKSPLLALMALTADQTNFSIPAETGVIADVKKGISKVVGEGEKKAQQITGAPTGPPPLTIADITRSFQPVQYVVPPGSERWINEKNSPYIDALTGLRNAIQALSRSSTDAPPDPQAGQAAADKALESAHQLEKGFNSLGVGTVDREVTRLLEEPITNARAFVIPPNPGQKVTAEMQNFCASFRSLLRKYPFSPLAPGGSEMTLKELADYFAPEEGKIWKLQKSAFAEFTILEAGAWKANPASQKVKASTELLDFLNRSQQIRSAFFAGGGTSPHLSYSLRPVLDPNSKQRIILNIDGQSHEFSADQTLQHTFTWPAAAGTEAKAEGRVAAAGIGSYGFNLHGGPWAVFRMFGEAEHRGLGERALEWKQLKSATGELQKLDPPVRLEFVGGAGVGDIFNPEFFKSFQCPATPVQ